MSRLHIYVADDQKATRYNMMPAGDAPHYRTNPPNRLIWADCCNRKRPARNLVAHVYYDAICMFCAQGKGCKSKAEIQAKADRLWNNRSEGQQHRRAFERLQRAIP